MGWLLRVVCNNSYPFREMLPSERRKISSSAMCLSRGLRCSVGMVVRYSSSRECGLPSARSTDKRSQ